VERGRGQKRELALARIDQIDKPSELSE